MKTFNRLAALGAMVALSSVSGCIVADDRGHYTDNDQYRGYYQYSDHDQYGDREQHRDHDRYRYDHGDRIDRDGHREKHWCDGHHDDEHCR